MTRAARRPLVGAIVLALLAGLWSASGAQASPQAAGAVSSFAYISTARQGAAVYANALIKQNSPSRVVRSANRTAYLQRNLDGHWQTVLSRVTNCQRDVRGRLHLDGQLPVSLCGAAERRRAGRDQLRGADGLDSGQVPELRRVERRLSLRRRTIRCAWTTPGPAPTRCGTSSSARRCTA